MIIFYDLVFSVIISISCIPLLIYLIRTGKIKYLSHYIVSYPGKSCKTNLFHCVSVGEANAVLRLAKMFREKPLISTTCEETFNFVRKKEPDVECIMYPLDISFIVRLFLEKNNVARIFVSEVDYWPNLFFQAKRNEIPVYILNGRMSEKTFGLYKKLKLFVQDMFESVKAVYVQNGQEKKHFEKFMAGEKIKDYGNLKFEDFEFSENTEIRNTVIAGSTHWPEERYIIDICRKKGKRLFIAPRNFRSNGKIFEYLDKKNIEYSLYSNGDLSGEVVIIDVFGVLDNIYPEGDIAYIGGGFIKTGVHNFIEPLKKGVPAIIGKNTGNFTNEYTMLESTGTVRKIDNIEKIGDILEDFYNSEIKYNIMENLRCFSEKHKNVSLMIYKDITG